MSGADTIRNYWPMIVTAAVVMMSIGAAQLQVSAQAGELEDLSEGVDENEEAIEEIQRLLIRRQGEVALDIQRIVSEQQQQGATLDQILRLLEQDQ